MSSDWSEYCIDDIKAKSPSSIAIGPFGSRMKSDCYVESGVRVVRGTNLSEGPTLSGEFVFISPEKAAELGGANLDPSDLVFPHRGAIGEVGIIPDDDEKYVLSSSLMKLKCDLLKADPKFIYYFFKSSVGRFELLKNSSQVGTPGIGQPLTSLKSIRLRLPDIAEQKRISAALGSLDNRITLLRETNQTLEAIAQALFKSWFVDFDPVRAKSEGRMPEGMDEATAALFPDSFEMSELGEIPRGWQVGDIGEIGEISTQKIHPGEFRSEIKYVGLEHMPRKCLSLSEWGSSAGLESSKAVFKKGSVLFGKLRPYFHKVVIAPFDGICSTDILVCQPKNPGNGGIFCLHLFSDELINFADRLSNGAKMPRVSWADVASYKIVIPPIDISTVFSKLIQPLFDAILGNVHRSKTLQELRDSLLPRLISGQLRLPDAEAEIEALTA